MTVEELKAKLPCAEVYELSAKFKYIFIIDPNYVTRAEVFGMLRSERLGIEVAVVFCDNPADAVRVLEVK